MLRTVQVKNGKLKGLVVKAHGNSKSAEIKTALGQCITFKENSINEKIQDKIQA